MVHRNSFEPPGFVITGCFFDVRADGEKVFLSELYCYLVVRPRARPRTPSPGEIVARKTMGAGS